MLESDLERKQALLCVSSLSLPQCYIAAGFLRNLVWDSLHNYRVPTPLNDVDVVYFDPTEQDPDRYLVYEKHLSNCLPHLNWQVRNQAAMHKKNHDPAYTSTLDAMSYWPEKETAVGVRLLEDGCYDFISAFGFESLLAGKVSHNDKRDKHVYESRLKTKQWLKKWPLLEPEHDI